MASPRHTPAAAPWGRPLCPDADGSAFVFYPHLRCIINLHCECMGGGARPVGCRRWTDRRVAGGCRGPTRTSTAMAMGQRKTSKCPPLLSLAFQKKRWQAQYLPLFQSTICCMWKWHLVVDRLHAPLPTHVLHLGLFPFSYCLTTFASAPFRRAIKLWAKMAERSFIHVAIFIIFLLSSSVRKLKIGDITVEKICCGVTLRSRA